MKTTLWFFLVSVFFTASAQKHVYDHIDAYNDSALIYRLAQESKAFLENVKPTDRDSKWHEKELANDTLMSCAKNRLRLFNNNKSYLPIGRPYEHVGIGSVELYPRPSESNDPNHQNAAVPEGVKQKCRIVEKQVHFFKDNKGRMVPYVNRYYVHKGRVLPGEPEKLNPVTLEKL